MFYFARVLKGKQMRKYYGNKLVLLFLCFMMPFGFAACKPKFSAMEPVSQSKFLLGTDCQITIYDPVDTKVFDKAFDRITEIEREMTVNSADTSEIIRLNQEAGKQEVKISADTFSVLEKGLYYSQLSEGRFDVTVGPLVKLWNINTSEAAIPSESDLQKVLPLIDYKKLHLNKETSTAKLDTEGMMVDLGGVAKGFTADEVGKVLRQNGVQHAIINLGGNVLTLGSKPSGEDWKVGVQHPQEHRGTYVGIVKVKNKTAVTSGTYERFFEKDGKIYHHILDKKTGYPVENNLFSATVITTLSSNGDGLSNTLFQMGVDRGMELQKQLTDIEVIFVTKDKKIYVSQGLKDSFELTDDSFQVFYK